MAYLPNQQIFTGQYIPTTFVFDVQPLIETDITSPEFKELLKILYQNLNVMQLSINIKETGIYDLQQFVTGSTWFNPSDPTNNPDLRRNEFRIAYNVGALGAGVTTIAHGLTIGSTWIFVDIWGAATDNIGGNYYPLPFSSATGANNIELRVDNTNIVITNNSGVAFTSCYVVLEYLMF